MRRLLTLQLVALLLIATAAHALTEAELRGLVPVSRTDLPRMLIDQLRWLPDSRHLAVGGWLDWPQTPMVAVLPNDVPAMQSGSQAASPHFALSPDGNALAFWRKVQVGQQDRAELTLVNFVTGVVSTLGEAVDISASLHLVWSQSAGPILYTLDDPQRNRGLLMAADLRGGRPYKVVELTDGAWGNLLPGPVPGQVLANWTGNKPGNYLIDYRTAQILPAGINPDVVRSPDGSGHSFEIDSAFSLQLTLSAVEAVVLDRGVRAAAWRPDGKALLYVKDNEAYLASPSGGLPHRFWRGGAADAQTFLRGCAWSPDGVRIVVWGVSGSSGRGWQAALGQERVSARFFFPAMAPVKIGSRLWIASKFYYDTNDTIIKPVWETLKAVFSVTKLLRTPEGTVAEAVSAGDQAGVADRVALSLRPATEQTGHINISIGGEVAANWTQAATLQFKPGLRAWLEGTHFTGRPQSLSLERLTLPPITKPTN
jgi:hypothetical protein